MQQYVDVVAQGIASCQNHATGLSKLPKGGEVASKSSASSEGLNEA
jgi:hypothetical protein